jgi:hypothetical protein
MSFMDLLYATSRHGTGDDSICWGLHGVSTLRAVAIIEFCQVHPLFPSLGK